MRLLGDNAMLTIYHKKDGLSKLTFPLDDFCPSILGIVGFAVGYFPRLPLRISLLRIVPWVGRVIASYRNPWEQHQGFRLGNVR